MNSEQLILHCGDVHKILPTLPSKSIAAVIWDPPYGTSNLLWDKPLRWRKIWPELWRICNSVHSPVILFAQELFTVDLIQSQRDNYKYRIVWNKVVSGNPFTCNQRPLPAHEDICVFGRNHVKYHPQKVKGAPNHTRHTSQRTGNTMYQANLRGTESDLSGMKYPTSVLTFQKHTASENLHPTQKPLDLMVWLILSYTKPGDWVLDGTFGSNSTGEACMVTGRNFIGIEGDKKYFTEGAERAKAAASQPLLFPLEEPALPDVPMQYEMFGEAIITS